MQNSPLSQTDSELVKILFRVQGKEAEMNLTMSDQPFKARYLFDGINERNLNLSTGIYNGEILASNKYWIQLVIAQPTNMMQ